MEVEPRTPETPQLQNTIQKMNDAGVKTLYGRWLVEGGPRVLLFDTGSIGHRLDEWKSDIWRVAGIPSPPGDYETNETILFGYLVSWFLGEVSQISRD
jgi:glycogen synthase